MDTKAIRPGTGWSNFLIILHPNVGVVPRARKTQPMACCDSGITARFVIHAHQDLDPGWRDNWTHAHLYHNASRTLFPRQGSGRRRKALWLPADKIQ